jgi:hypothetical protein
VQQIQKLMLLMKLKMNEEMKKEQQILKLN